MIHPIFWFQQFTIVILFVHLSMSINQQRNKVTSIAKTNKRGRNDQPLNDDAEEILDWLET